MMPRTLPDVLDPVFVGPWREEFANNLFPRCIVAQRRRLNENCQGDRAGRVRSRLIHRQLTQKIQNELMKVQRNFNSERRAVEDWLSSRESNKVERPPR